jgi:hypothetical protein
VNVPRAAEVFAVWNTVLSVPLGRVKTMCTLSSGAATTSNSVGAYVASLVTRTGVIHVE